MICSARANPHSDLAGKILFLRNYIPIPIKWVYRICTYQAIIFGQLYIIPKESRLSALHFIQYDVTINFQISMICIISIVLRKCIVTLLYTLILLNNNQSTCFLHINNVVNITIILWFTTFVMFGELTLFLAILWLCLCEILTLIFTIPEESKSKSMTS